MKQAVLEAPQKFEIREVPKPVPDDDEALIRVRAMGICGSDIHAYYGKHPFIHCPIVPGHEISGEVVETGKNVSGLKAGDRVVLRPQKVCGECYPCRTGRYNICEKLEVLGCQETGGCSDYFAAKGDLLYRIPDSVDFAEGTVIEPLAVGVHAAKRGLADFKGKKVLVIGAGTIGNLVAQSVKGLGASQVMITDVSDFRLEMAKKCGIPYAVNVKTADLKQAAEDYFGPDGMDAVYECSANESALNQVLNIARKGIPIVIVGVFGNQANINLANVQDREYQLIGTLMYRHDDYLEAIRLVEEGKVDLKTLISKKFDMTQIAEAFKYIERYKDTVQKVILSI